MLRPHRTIAWPQGGRPNLQSSFVSRVVCWVDVGKAPRSGAIELDNRVLIDEGKVCHTGREGEETARRQGSGLAFVSLLPHAQAERAGDDRGDLGLRVPMRRDDVPTWKFDAVREDALFTRITVEHRH